MGARQAGSHRSPRRASNPASASNCRTVFKPSNLDEIHAAADSLRCMPASVRFLGRRVYWGVVVLLATALCSGLSLRRGRQLTQQLSVPVLTLLRWRHWWLSEFTRTAVWQELRGKLLPPLAAAELPAGLLQRVVALDTPTAMAMILRWLAPLSTLTEERSRRHQLTQKMALARAVIPV